MYETRRTADRWHCEYSDTIEELGFQRGQSSACVFWHPQRHLICSVHGDDFTTAGPKKSLDWFKEMLCKRYELIEGARLGPGPSDDKEGRVLNRVVRWTPDGVTYEADPRHYEKLVQELGLGQPEETGASGRTVATSVVHPNPVKAVSTPCVKVTTEMASQDAPLPAAKVSHFRGLAARANYLAAERPDIQ